MPDYTSVIAFGSLVIVLGGALIFYLGMVVCDRIEREYGKEGIAKKYDKIKYYKQGALLLEDCLSLFTVIIIVSYLILSFYIASLIKDIPNVTFSIFITNPNNIGKVFFYIGAFDIILTITQIFILIWLKKQVDICDNDPVKYPKEPNEIRIRLFVILASISLFNASIIASDFLYTDSNGSPLQVNYLFLAILVIVVYIVVPIILALLILSDVAYLIGYSIAREELSELKPVMKFIVHFTDEKTLDGQKLSYENGIYTLSKSNASDNMELNYIMSEDKVHHIERIYDNEKPES